MASATRPVIERLYDKFTFDPDGCWRWKGAVGRKGYGAFHVRGHSSGMREPHRLFYEMLCGPVPRGLVLDHQCDNTRCVNPGHLRVTTQRENILRGTGLAAQRARQTQCANGHEFDLLNTIITRGHRRCRICRDAANRARYN